MRLLTYTYTAIGRNRTCMLQRLSAAKIAVCDLRILNEKTVEITISAKDRAKYFAICKNMWYNDLKCVGGVLAPLFRIFSSPAYIAGIAVFTVLTAIADGVYLGPVYRGEAIFYKAAIEEALVGAGVERYAFFDDLKLGVAEKTLESTTGANFIKIEKSGNRAIITAYGDKKVPERINSSAVDVCADGDYKILKITVYAGTPLVKSGDEVKCGDVLIGAYEQLTDGSVIHCDAVGFVTVEREFKYDFACVHGVTEASRERALSAAAFLLGDKTVLRSTVDEYDGGLSVTLFYEEIIFGSENYGG